MAAYGIMFSAITAVEVGSVHTVIASLSSLTTQIQPTNRYMLHIHIEQKVNYACIQSKFLKKCLLNIQKLVNEASISCELQGCSHQLSLALKAETYHSSI